MDKSCLQCGKSGFDFNDFDKKTTSERNDCIGCLLRQVEEKIEPRTSLVFDFGALSFSTAVDVVKN